MAWYHQWASFAKRLAHVVAKPMKRDSGRSGMMVHPYPVTVPSGKYL